MIGMFEKAFKKVAKRYPEAIKELAKVVAKGLKEQEEEDKKIAKKAANKMKTVCLAVETCSKKGVLSVSKFDLVLPKEESIVSVSWE